ncbi:exodeoxyribonuclease VII large subunit [Roseomonas sp. CCTCC AB2023176]|uniref:exodeoxyribonuclease VII large subunit n=1 Tax=Roseomonas sp. CCTCC AB2023176 TaxID=3342640 RepID=UPI0035D8FA13
MPDTPASNVPEYSVAELSGAVKRTLESAFGRVRVRGEITELKVYPSGHTYLTLKDEAGTLRAIIWRGSLRGGVKPENGVEFIATGKITASDKRSDFALVIERLEYAGEGALLARIELLRQRFVQEGLFDEARKKPIPFLPDVIGVVTSEKGAVIQDIRTTIARRFPRPILLYPVQVQGAGSAEAVAAAIAAMGALSPLGAVRRPDVLIVARGGGSLEDLMAFNEEVVVRAAAACPIPLISAVGHETDTTLIDFASDRRAPTPTAAAEMAVPAREELAAAVHQRGLRLGQAGASVLNRARLRLSRAGAGLPDLPGMLRAARDRLHDRGERLRLAPRSLLATKRRALENAAGRLPRPQEAIAARRATLDLLGQRAGAATARLIARQSNALARVPDTRPLLRARLRDATGALGRATDRLAGAARADLAERSEALARVPDPMPYVQGQLRTCRASLGGLAARLEAASYQSVLDRGFVLVRDESGAAVTRAAAVAAGARLSVQFADGTVQVTEGEGTPSRGAEEKPKRAARSKDQGSLL